MEIGMAFMIKKKCLAKELTNSFHHLEPKLSEILTLIFCMYKRILLSEARPLSFWLKEN